MGFNNGEAMWAKVSCVCLVVALLLHLVAFGSPWWAKSNPNVMSRNEHIGLWRYCTDVIGGGDNCDDFIDITTSDWLKGAQSFMTLGMFGLMGSIGAAAVAAFVMNDGEPKPIIASVVVTGITAVFLIIGVGVFGGKYSTYFINKESGLFGPEAGQLSWAFGVAATSLLLTFASLALMIFELIVGRRD
jgi:hypothetical protein